MGNCCGLGSSHTPCQPQPRHFSARASFAGFTPVSQLTASEGIQRLSRGAGLAPGNIPQLFPLSPRAMGVIPGDAIWCSDRGRAVRTDAISDGSGALSSLPSLLACIRHTNTRTPHTHTHAQTHIWKLQKPNAN